MRSDPIGPGRGIPVRPVRLVRVRVDHGQRAAPGSDAQQKARSAEDQADAGTRSFFEELQNRAMSRS